MVFYQSDNFTLCNGDTMNLLADNVRQVDMIFADPILQSPRLKKTIV